MQRHAELKQRLEGGTARKWALKPHKCSKPKCYYGLREDAQATRNGDMN